MQYDAICCIASRTAVIQITSRRGLRSQLKRTAGPLPTMAEVAHFHMPLFRPGTPVLLADKTETISHIVVRRSLLLVHLVGHEKPVHSDTLVLEPTLFISTRV